MNQSVQTFPEQKYHLQSSVQHFLHGTHQDLAWIWAPFMRQGTRKSIHRSFRERNCGCHFYHPSRRHRSSIIITRKLRGTTKAAKLLVDGSEIRQTHQLSLVTYPMKKSRLNIHSRCFFRRILNHQPVGMILDIIPLSHQIVQTAGNRIPNKTSELLPG